MSLLRLHAASVLSIACALASGCAFDASEPVPTSHEPVTSTREAAVVGGNSLVGGSRLNSGDVLYSTSQKIYLTMQTDGNLALRFSPFGTWSVILWASNTYGNPGAYAVMQDDGNFVVYTPQNCQRDPQLGVPICSISKPLWATGTNPNGSLLWVQDDGNLVVYDAHGSPLWAPGTNDLVPDAAHCRTHFCPSGTWWHSCDWDKLWGGFDCRLERCGIDDLILDEPCYDPANPASQTIVDYTPSNRDSITSCTNNNGALNCTSTTGTWNCQYDSTPYPSNCN